MQFRSTAGTPKVAALILDSRLAAFYRRAIHERCIGRLCGDKTELSSCLQSNTGIEAVMLSACDEAGRSTAPLVRFIGHRHPTIPVIALASLSADNVKALIAATRAGLSDVILIDHDDALAVLNNCIRRNQSPMNYALPDELTASVPTSMRTEVAACLAVGIRRPGVDDIAKMLGITRRTLATRLSHTQLPPAGELISWGRVLAAAVALTESRRSVESVALALSFGSASALHNIVRRYTGLTPLQLRQAGGRTFVLCALQRTLSASRTGARPERSDNCELELPLG